MNPTPRQAEYIRFIANFTDRWGYPPSFDEIGRHFRVTPPSVNNMVKTLERKGFLARIPGAARSLRVLVPLEGRQEPQVEPAIQMGSLVVERLVPALRDQPSPVLHAALDAVTDALQIALAGRSDAERRDATEALYRTARIAQGLGAQ